MQTIVDTVFKKATNPYCGPINFRFVSDATQPFTYDSVTEVFTFSPLLTDSVGTVTNQAAQFYFADFPSRVWNAPIQLDTLACVYTTNQEAYVCNL